MYLKQRKPKMRLLSSVRSEVKALALLLVTGMGLGFTPLANAAISCATAPAVSLNASTGLKQHLAGGNETYKVVAPSSGLLSVFATTNNGIRLSLYNQNCLPLTGAFFNTMSNQSVAPGTYYIVTSGGTASSYELRLDGDFSTDDRGNTCSNAWIVRSRSETGTAGPYGDMDFFQFTLTTSQLFKAKVISSLGARLRVYNNNCIPISGFYSNNISFAMTPGLYYISVIKGSSTPGTNSYPYQLNFDPTASLRFPVGTCGGKAATLSGTNGDDVIRGTAGNDVIQANLGNDVVYGLAGNDTLCGGEGDDVLVGADGTDILNGDGGNDILQGGNANDALNGGLGSDICDGGALTDTATACEVRNLVP